MALLTEDGTLYLLTMSHEDAAPYEKAKELAAAIVDVKGPVNERGGMKAIEVTAIQEVDLPDDLGRSDNSPGTIPDTIGTPIDGKKPAAAMMYLCSMHPDVRQDHPGDCPKCGMRLRPEGK